jgi:hypothetical protein
MKLWKALRGVLWGTGIILVAYALLPEDYRFSRALILIGTLWVLIAVSLVRQAMQMLKLDGFKKDTLRILIIGKEEECKRVHSLLDKTNVKIEAVHYLTPEQTTTTNGTILNAWSEKMMIYHINEVIFCAKDLSSQLIMDAMSSIPHPELEFKIAPPESWAVIGSNSIHTSGELYVIDVEAINTTPNIRSKRILDFSCSLLLFILSPLFIWFQKKPLGYFANIFNVLFGKKSWVGYAYPTDGKLSQRLPAIKKGILSPLTLNDLSLSATIDTIHNVNTLYARDYRVLTDLRIIWNGFRDIGKKS